MEGYRASVYCPTVRGHLEALLQIPLSAWCHLCFFYRFALYHAELDSSKCVSCGKCSKVCRMCIDPYKTPNSMECIRCGDCVHACPKEVLRMGFLR